MIHMRKPLPKLDATYGNAVISSGTLLESDLLQAMSEALLEAHPNDNDANYALSLLGNYGNFGWKTDLYCTLMDSGYLPHDAYSVIWDVYNLLTNILPDRLNEVAPQGYAFGLHPTEPMLIGFWPMYK